ncbi:MAG: hypothetical protein Kow00108_17020 [Calditrichia bacterium]
MKTLEELERLAKLLEQKELPRAEGEWGGADVIITKESPPKKAEEGFYPEPRYVVTQHSLELSWLFERLRDAFYAEKRLDGCSKIEFFGRLANAALRCMRNSSDASAHILYAAVLHEAFAIYYEMEDGNFECLPIARGNEIVDDHRKEDERTGYTKNETTFEFFRKKGIKINL